MHPRESLNSFRKKDLNYDQLNAAFAFFKEYEESGFTNLRARNRSIEGYLPLVNYLVRKVCEQRHIPVFSERYEDFYCEAQAVLIELFEKIPGKPPEKRNFKDPNQLYAYIKFILPKRLSTFAWDNHEGVEVVSLDDSTNTYKKDVLESNSIEAVAEYLEYVPKTTIETYLKLLLLPLCGSDATYNAMRDICIGKLLKDKRINPQTITQKYKLNPKKINSYFTLGDSIIKSLFLMISQNHDIEVGVKVKNNKIVMDKGLLFLAALDGYKELGLLYNLVPKPLFFRIIEIFSNSAINIPDATKYRNLSDDIDIYIDFNDGVPVDEIARKYKVAASDIQEKVTNIKNLTRKIQKALIANNKQDDV